MKISLQQVEKELLPENDDPSEDEEEESNISDTKEKKENAAISLILRTSSKHEYQQIRNELKLELKIPSWYHVVQSRPKMIGYVIDKSMDKEECSTVTVLQDDVNNTSCNLNVIDTIIPTHNRQLASDTYGEKCTSTALVQHAAKIDGDYDYYVNKLLMKKFGQINLLSSTNFRNRNTSSILGLIDTYDGAQHVVTDAGITNVTSYSTLLFSNATITRMGKSNSESGNILTWQQIVGKEEPTMVISSVKTHYDEKLALQSKYKDEQHHVCMYDMHNGKMMYILTGHGLWNRTHKPFLLCKCK